MIITKNNRPLQMGSHEKYWYSFIRSIYSFLTSVEKTLKNGGKVSLIGFGSFSVSKRAARIGRNPQTGKELNIPARNIPKFKAGAKLVEVVN